MSRAGCQISQAVSAHALVVEQVVRVSARLCKFSSGSHSPQTWGVDVGLAVARLNHLNLVSLWFVVVFDLVVHLLLIRFTSIRIPIIYGSIRSVYYFIRIRLSVYHLSVLLIDLISS